jgi:hypothetical protein
MSLTLQTSVPRQQPRNARVPTMRGGVAVRILTIFDTVEDFKENSQEKLRERAMAKLTPAEIQALGLNIKG